MKRNAKIKVTTAAAIRATVGKIYTQKKKNENKRREGRSKFLLLCITWNSLSMIQVTYIIFHLHFNNVSTYSGYLDDALRRIYYQLSVRWCLNMWNLGILAYWAIVTLEIDKFTCLLSTCFYTPSDERLWRSLL